jgi:hypothetical protein
MADPQAMRQIGRGGATKVVEVASEAGTVVEVGAVDEGSDS